MAIRPMCVVEPASAPSVVIGSSQVLAACATVSISASCVGEEDRIEEAGLGTPREVAEIVYVGQRQRRGVGMPPRCFVVAAALDEKIEVELAWSSSCPHCAAGAYTAASWRDTNRA